VPVSGAKGLMFEPPGGGVWEQNAHHPEPVTLLFMEVYPEAIKQGLRIGTSRYGLLFDYFETNFVHGFCYFKARSIGMPANARGRPSRLLFGLKCRLHPVARRRLGRAATVLREKPWRGEVRRWDTVDKPHAAEIQLRIQSVDPSGLTDPALADHLIECRANLKAMTLQHHVYTLACCIPVGDLIAHVTEWTGLPVSETVEALGGSSPISAGVTCEYEAALQAISADPEALKILSGSDLAADALSRLQALPGPTGLAVKSYLDLVSYRIIGGYDVTCPTAVEQPEVLLEWLRRPYSSCLTSAVEARAKGQIARVREAVPERHKGEFDELLEEARIVGRLRDERTWWGDIWASGLMRRAVLEAGRRLAAGGVLEKPDHLLDASFAEILALLDGHIGAPSPDGQELAARRASRNAMPIDMAPPVLGGKPCAPPVDWYPTEAQRTVRAMEVAMEHLHPPVRPAPEAVTLRGMPVSGGCYEGRACVVDRIKDLGELEKGDVLVTRATSSALNHVLPLLGAIVTDRGGLMSHAAIVAREFGLPAVVGCQSAARIIPNGARVRVDANKGEVTILS
jgi:rifampicin phosphotransferase